MQQDESPKDSKYFLTLHWNLNISVVV